MAQNSGEGSIKNSQNTVLGKDANGKTAWRARRTIEREESSVSLAGWRPGPDGASSIPDPDYVPYGS